MFTFYEVGGKVRDELMGLESKDIDYVAVPSDLSSIQDVDMLFKMLVAWLQEHDYQIFLQTPDCFTVRAKFPEYHPRAGVVADFVLARKEIGYKKRTREPIVVPGTLYDDLSRRDFTINAIAKSVDGTLIDPFDGQKDIKNRILRTPISGDITFDDDPLRLIRAIRFCITKGISIGEDVSNFIECYDYEEKFYVVSEERIREELHKCFRYNTIYTLITLNRYHKLRDYIFENTNLWLKPTSKK